MFFTPGFSGAAAAELIVDRCKPRRAETRELSGKDRILQFCCRRLLAVMDTPGVPPSVPVALSDV